MEHRTLRRWVAAAAALGAALTISPAAARPRWGERAEATARYIADHQTDDGAISGGFSQVGTTADAVFAFMAAGRGERQIERAIGWLREHVDEADTLGLKAKVVIAAVAADVDPRSFGGRDLVDEIQDTVTEEGQYGGESNTEVGYHALAMVALGAAGADVPESAVQWLIDAQCGDGGWQFDEPSTDADDEHCFDSGAESDFARSDTNTTAYAVHALALHGAADPPADPFAFFRSARDPYKKGWVYDPSGKCTEETLGEEFCYLTDANSTALVLQAYTIGGEEPPRAGRYALIDLQYRLCGPRMGAFAFGWQYDPETETFRKDGPSVGATVAAPAAIRALPFGRDRLTVTKPPPKRRPCR